MDTDFLLPRKSAKNAKNLTADNVGQRVPPVFEQNVCEPFQSCRAVAKGVNVIRRFSG
jgi:hypothetical protein